MTFGVILIFCTNRRFQFSTFRMNEMRSVMLIVVDEHEHAFKETSMTESIQTKSKRRRILNLATYQ